MRSKDLNCYSVVFAKLAETTIYRIALVIENDPIVIRKNLFHSVTFLNEYHQTGRIKTLYRTDDKLLVFKGPIGVLIRDLLDVIDVREDGQDEDDTNYETCMMCGKEKIRFVHILEHNEVKEEFRVGCVCSEKMSSDYINPKRLENDLRNKAARCTKWITKEWNTAKMGINI